MTLAEVSPSTDGDPRIPVAVVRDASLARVLAVVVDLFVLSVIDGFVNFVFGVTRVTGGSPVPAAGQSFTQFTSVTDVAGAWLVVLWLIYYMSLEALFGATVGKWMLGLRVTDTEGRQPSFKQILVRNVVRIVDGLPVMGYLLGGVVALLSPRRQRLGDHLAHTVVIRRGAITAPWLTPEQVGRRLALVSAILLVSVGGSVAFFYYGRPPLVVQGMANTRQMMFSDGVNSYTLGAPTWGAGTVTYDITYHTTRSVNTCHARLTLDWAFPTGWQPANSMSSCEAPTP